MRVGPSRQPREDSGERRDAGPCGRWRRGRDPPPRQTVPRPWGPPRPPEGAPQNFSPSPPPSPPSPPLPAPGPAPPPDLAAMTSSIRSLMTAASVAEEMAWLPTRLGSITFSFFMSETLPLKTLIPAVLFPFL